MKLIETIMELYSAMSTDEKRELITAIGKRVVDDGVLTESEMDSMVGGSTSKPKKKGRGNFRPYWIKAVDSLDTSKKGIFSVVGGWVNDVEKDLGNGALCMIGCKNPKYYYLCERKDGSSVEVTLGSDTKTIDGLSVIVDSAVYGDVHAEITKRLT
jgi:hypothetical protein